MKMVRARFEICFYRSYERTGLWKMEEKARKGQSSWPDQVEFEGGIFQSGYVTFKMSVRTTRRNFQTGGWTNEPGVQERDQGWK